MSLETILLVGSAMQGAGSIFQGASGGAAADYNAAVARQNAIIAQQQGVAAVEAQQRTAARTQGSIIANYGASGVQADSGSPLDVLADSARMAELDKLTTQYNYQLKAAGFTQQAALSDMQAKAARTSGIIGAIGAGVKGYGGYLSIGGTPIPTFGGGSDTLNSDQEALNYYLNR